MCSFSEPAPTEEVTDWAALVEEEEWKAKHDTTKLDKKEAKVIEVKVASCSDDGTMRLWHPLEVSGQPKCVVQLFIFYK